ncbi:hypothetical protein ACR2V2_25900, partial [Klebsiella pneumoniae]
MRFKSFQSQSLTTSHVQTRAVSITAVLCTMGRLSVVSSSLAAMVAGEIVAVQALASVGDPGAAQTNHEEGVGDVATGASGLLGGLVSITEHQVLTPSGAGHSVHALGEGTIRTSSSDEALVVFFSLVTILLQNDSVFIHLGCKEDFEVGVEAGESFG